MQVAAPAKAGDLPDANGDDDRSVTETFARVNVTEVHFHGRKFHRGNRIANGIGIVGESTWIDENPTCPDARFVNGVNDHAFVVALRDA